MQLVGQRIFLVGMKGTGMASLAILLAHAGASVAGCDVAEVFSTDSLLAGNGLTCSVGFSKDLLPGDVSMVVHSSAWKVEGCPVLQEAARQGIVIYSYPQMLAWLSEQCTCYAVAGTHGKTTTTGCATWLLSRPQRSEFPFFSLYGSAVQSSSGSVQAAGVWQGDEVGLLEACEYQDHFLSYSVRGALVTSIEHDHPDYFANLAQVKKSFQQFVAQLAPGGFLICCVDDQGAKELASWAKKHRPDLMVVTYGYHDNGPFGIRDTSPIFGESKVQGLHRFEVSLLRGRPFYTQLFGKELTGDIVGGCLLASCMLLDRPDPKLFLKPGALICDEILSTVLGDMLDDVKTFGGCVGREEVLFEDNGVLYIDDYAHHPTEIKVTLESLRLRFPSRPLVVSFCPHTASRSKAYFKDFVQSLSLADKLIIQATYASARNDSCSKDDIAQDLANTISNNMFKSLRPRTQAVIYAKDDATAVGILSGWLQSGDLCITMGAGNNRALAWDVAKRRAQS